MLLGQKLINILNGDAVTTWGIDITAPELDAFTLNAELTSKESPDDLAEYVNSASQKVGASIYVLEPNSRVRYVTNKFYLSNLGIDLKERVQLLESFESSHVSFFEEAVRVYNFGGVALDYESSDPQATHKYFHQSSLIKMYSDVLRGTKLIERDCVAVLKVKNHLIYGYPFRFNTSYDARVDKVAQFSMQMVVVDHKLENPITPAGGGGSIVTERKLKQMYTRNINDSESGPYIEEINGLLDPINDLLSLRYWGVSPYDDKTERRDLVAQLGVDSLTGITHGYFYNLSSKYKTMVKETLTEKMETLQAKIKSFQEKDGEGNYKKRLALSVLKYFLEDNDSEWSTVLSSIQTMTDEDNVDAFDKFSLFITKLTILKNDLLVFKARLLY